ncbi:MAG: hypothetical protein ACK5IQ_04995 [Bacteroidales bacterium]
MSGAKVDNIYLGTVAANGTGDDVQFVLRPVAGTPCDLGAAGAAGAVESSSVTWVSSSLNKAGLGNQAAGDSAAKDAYALLSSDYSENGNKSKNITIDNPVATFSRANLISKAGAMPFKIKLIAGKKPGAFATSATYLVTYE